MGRAATARSELNVWNFSPRAPDLCGTARVLAHFKFGRALQELALVTNVSLEAGNLAGCADDTSEQRTICNGTLHQRHQEHG